MNWVFFNTPKEKELKQFNAFSTYRNKACDERNRVNRAKWEQYGKSLWEQNSLVVTKVS